MSKFSLVKTTHATKENVYDVFSDYENYQRLAPQHFPSVRVRSIRGDTSVVEEHMNLGEKELVIMAKHVVKAPVLHEIFVIGGDAKGSYVKEQFIEVSEGTKIVVDVDLKLRGKMKISNMLGKTKFEEDYAKILDDFIKIAEN